LQFTQIILEFITTLIDMVSLIL